MFRISRSSFKPLDKQWDVIIIGGGPAGVVAGLYSARYGLKTLLISPDKGGMLTEASFIENYPGFISISGPDLAERLFEQYEKNGGHYLKDKVSDIKKDKNFIVITEGGYELEAKAIILATGSRRRKLNVKGENLPGVSYCAECDAPLFKGKTVAVVGGGNTAFHDALVLSNYANKVYLIHRRDQFRAESYLVENAKKKDNIEFILNSVVKEIRGQNKVESIIVQDKEGNTKELKVDGVFVAIGMETNIELAKKLGVQLDERGKIIVDRCQRTNIQYVYAAGNITNNCCDLDQIVTSMAQGAIAAKSAYEDLLK